VLHRLVLALPEDGDVIASSTELGTMMVSQLRVSTWCAASGSP